MIRNRYKSGVNINNLAIAAGIAVLLWPSTASRIAYFLLLFSSLLVHGVFLLPFRWELRELPKHPVPILPTTALSYSLIMILIGWGVGGYCFPISVAVTLVTYLLSRKFRGMTLKINESINRDLGV